MELRILDKQPMEMAELASEMKKIKKKEMKALQQKTGDYALKFSKLNKDREAKLYNDMLALEIPRLDKEHVASIVNLLPRNETELKIIFSASKTTIAPENIIKILETLEKYEK